MTACTVISGQFVSGPQTPSAFGCAEAGSTASEAAASAPSRDKWRAREASLPVKAEGVVVTRDLDIVSELKRSLFFVLLDSRVRAADVSPHASGEVFFTARELGCYGAAFSSRSRAPATPAIASSDAL